MSFEVSGDAFVITVDSRIQLKREECSSKLTFVFFLKLLIAHFKYGLQLVIVVEIFWDE